MRGRRRAHAVARAIAKLLDGYHVWISPLFGNACRFEPSCSRYAAAAMRRHGVLRGGLLSVKRLSRCHPFDEGGFDPVP